MRVVLWLIFLLFCFCGDEFITFNKEDLERFDHLELCCCHLVSRARFQAHHHSGASYCLLLLLSGDISLNPGPIRYPCTVCGKSVKSNQKALSCDVCQEWSHANCAGVDDSLYCKLQSVAHFSWQCPSCLFTVLPSDEVCDYNDFTLPQSPARYLPLE